MKNTGENKKHFLSFVIVATLLCALGIPAHAAPTAQYTLVTAPSALSFSWKSGNAAPAAKTVKVMDNSPNCEPVIATSNQSWLTISPSGPCTAPLILTVSINTSGLTAGHQSGSITITGATEANAPYTIPVTLTVTGASSTGGSGSSTGSGSGTSVTPPVIMMQPSSQSVIAGKSATFNVSAAGTSPMTFQWKKNGSPISGATSSTYTTPAETTANNNSQFSVSVQNAAGSATSNTATLAVTAASTASTPQYTLVTAPSSLSFSWAAGSAAPAAQTIKVMDNSANCEPVTATSNQSWLIVSPSGPCTAPLMLTVSINTTGLAAGSHSGSITITGATELNSPFTVPVTVVASGSTATAPAITTQPASQAVTSGKTATFNVAATGTSPMTYQWSKNGAAISGATSSSYTTPAETTTDNKAQFTVTLSNSAGTATSNPAVLTVSPATTSTLLLNASSTSLSFGSVTVSTSSTQNVTLTNAGTSNITISNVTVNGAGFTTSGVSSGLILTPGQTTTLTATFTPATTSSVTGSVTVASNATNSPDSIALSGTGAAAVNHSVALSWNASTSTVAGYNTYASTVSGGPYTKLTSAPIAGTSYTDASVQAGNTYYFVVTSVSTTNVESTYSSEISATVP